MTKDEFMFMPMAKAFANGGDREETIELDSELKMNLTTGFPPVYSQPLASGGRLIQRKELNLLFYQMTLFQNFIQNGGCITWDSNVMSAIGGYPSGAILSIVDAESGIETRVQSMIDNNYLKPTSDTIGVKYKVNTSSTPNTYTKDDSGDVLWRYVKTNSGGGLWSDFETRDFLFGSHLHLSLGPYQITDGVVTGKIKAADRSRNVGWHSVKGLTIPLEKDVTYYKKLLFAFADEDGNDTIDDDTQIFFQEIDTEKYCWLYEMHQERENIFNTVKSMTKGESRTFTIADTTFKYSYDRYRGTMHNDNGWFYPYPNTVRVFNASQYSTWAPCFGSNPDYRKSLHLEDNNAGVLLVAIVGLR